jgi:hypothetical protein
MFSQISQYGRIFSLFFLGEGGGKVKKHEKEHVDHHYVLEKYQNSLQFFLNDCETSLQKWNFVGDSVKIFEDSHFYTTSNDKNFTFLEKRFKKLNKLANKF